MIIDHRIASAMRAERSDEDKKIRLRFTVDGKSLIVATFPEEKLFAKQLQVEKEHETFIGTYEAFGLLLVEVVRNLPTYEELMERLDKEGVERL